MDWHLVLGVISGVLGIASVVPYLRGMLKGTTRPSIVSQFLWMTIQWIAVAAQISAGASWSVIIVIATAFNCTLIVLLALFGYGYRKYRLSDLVSFALAVFAIVLWQVTDEPVVALLLAVLANFLAAIPTIIKSYRDPGSEERNAWFLIMVAALCAVLSTTVFTLENLLFPIYLVLETGTIFFLTAWGQRQQQR